MKETFYIVVAFKLCVGVLVIRLCGLMTIDVISGIEILWFLYYVMLIYHFAIWLIKPLSFIHTEACQPIRFVENPRQQSCENLTPEL